MFEAIDLSFGYGGRQRMLLDGVSLRVQQGQILGIRGASGSGKTTLARLLAGYLQPARGSVALAGSALGLAGVSAVQLVFQHAETAVDPRWRIRRILSEGWHPDDDTLTRFGVRNEWLDRYPHELSGGELQRVAMVRALVPTLRVLIVDELTAMHDAITQARLWRALLETTVSRQMTVIAISHDAALLHAIGAKILTLQDGRLMAGDITDQATGP